MEAVRKLLPNYKIVVTFFSPSGYEVKKNAPIADVITYLPLDTSKNAAKFVSIVHPSLAIFVKYEFWPNYLFTLESNKIPAVVVSALFRSKQVFFKSHGGFMRKALRTLDHIFVQDVQSSELLSRLNMNNWTISGDTRFDRVSHQIEQNNSLEFMDRFKGTSLCVVCGSTWPEDEAVLLNAINDSSEKLKFVIAPHKIDASKIKAFRSKINKPSILYSELNNTSEKKSMAEHTVLIVDTIGLLTKIYSYADIAYVGGAMGVTGLHNILEPATFGVPIVIGKNYKRFPEAVRLRQLAGLFSVSNNQECTEILDKLITNKSFRDKTGMISEHFINSNTGATEKIMNYISKLNSNSLV
jgi:3-deoxy-D-manno-octulosonic-acid transferase